MKIITLPQSVTVYATPTGLKVGSKGRVEKGGALFARLDKGRARVLRKALRAAGLKRHAAAPRI
jgi:hypothetical protein